MQKFVQFVFVLKHGKCVCPLIRTGIGASVLPEVSIYMCIYINALLRILASSWMFNSFKKKSDFFGQLQQLY